MENNFPPSQSEITIATLKVLAEAGGMDRATLRTKLEGAFEMTDAQKTFQGFGKGPLWQLRFRHAVADLADAGLIAVSGRGGRGHYSTVTITEIGLATFAAGTQSVLASVTANRSRQTGDIKVTRKRHGYPLPKCGEILRAILEVIDEAGKPLAPKEVSNAVGLKLGITTQIFAAHSNHDMLRARVATSSHRLWKAKLVNRTGNGRHYLSNITDLGRAALANPAISPIKLPAAILQAA